MFCHEMCLNVYITEKSGAMKNFIPLSLISIACTVGSAAQAADLGPSSAPLADAAAWTEKDGAPGHPDEVPAPAPAAIRTTELGIFPSLAAPPAASLLPPARAGAGPAMLVQNKDIGLDSFLGYLNLPQSSAAFPSAAESGAADAMRDKTELANQSDTSKSITEPASEVLMLGALAALAIAVRRRMPNERF